MHHPFLNGVVCIGAFFISSIFKKLVTYGMVADMSSVVQIEDLIKQQTTIWRVNNERLPANHAVSPKNRWHSIGVRHTEIYTCYYILLEKSDVLFIEQPI